MRNFYKIIVATTLLIMSFSSLAAYVAPGQWRCAAVDSTHRAYVAVADNIQWAMKQSLKMCLQMSPYKRSCSISPSYCTQGQVKHHHHRHHCVVSDAHGRTWVNRGRRACAKAMAECRQWHFAHGMPNGGICVVR